MVHRTTSSAPRRADGRGETIIAGRFRADARPFHCRGGKRHRWGVAWLRKFLPQRGGNVRVEYCKRVHCNAMRFTPVCEVNT